MESEPNLKAIVRNRVRCLHCDTTIESLHRHDHRTCPCGSVSVDGGHDYVRRAWNPARGRPEHVFEELSEWAPQ